jgi:polyisoprenoid-binding protein YceI
MTVDPAESSVEFSVKTLWGLATVHGRFDRFEGAYEDNQGGARIELTIDADSLDTGNRTRDKHLRSGDFFQVAEHPKVRFTSTRVHPVGGEDVLHVVGRLEAGGRTVQLEFPATVRHAFGGIDIEATATLDQRELGMSSGMLGMIRRPVTLHVAAHVNA